jgi:hypothetical protein
MPTIFEVLHDLRAGASGGGAAARFSQLAEAQAFAQGRTFHGEPARVRAFEIPTNSSALWNVDSALGAQAAGAAPQPCAASRSRRA